MIGVNALLPWMDLCLFHVYEFVITVNLHCFLSTLKPCSLGVSPLQSLQPTGTILKVETKPFPETELGGTLILDFLSSRIIENMFSLQIIYHSHFAIAMQVRLKYLQ